MNESIDIASFGELIDDYQCAQIDGTLDERANARSALMSAYRAALASSDAQADGGKSEAVYQARWVGEVKWRDVTHDEFVTAQKGLLSEDREFRVLFTAPQAECAPRKPLKALYEVLMRRNIECGSEAYLTLRCVGVPPSKKEFVRAIEQAAKEKA